MRDRINGGATKDHGPKSGRVYGFVGGGLIGAAFCWLYNRFAGMSSEPKGKSA